MNSAPQLKCLLLGAFACALAARVPAAVVVNGGFESGFTGWTRVDQLGSAGTFYSQTGTISPVNAFTVPAPPGGTFAAMTDAAGPGSHVLYQDFVVPTGVSTYTLAFSLFVNNTAGTFFTPQTLDFATSALNQRARVDIIKTTADPFSLAATDILQSLFETTPGSPAVMGYTAMTYDVTSLFQANSGATVRLRFAEVDNVNFFNLGVDNVDIRIGGATAVPDTLPAAVQWITLLGVTLVGGFLRRKTKARAGVGAGDERI